MKRFIGEGIMKYINTFKLRRLSLIRTMTLIALCDFTAQSFSMAPSKNEIRSDALAPKTRSMMLNEEINASILGFDLTKVKDLTQKNTSVNYGVTFVAGHPITGEPAERLQGWQREILKVTNGKVRINVEHSHATIGALVRSQVKPVGEDNLSKIDFNGALGAISKAGSYQLHFKQVKLSDGQEGNIVLRGEVEGDSLSDLQKAFSEAGFPLKWAPGEPGKIAEVFITLGHVDTDALNALTSEETEAFKKWLEVHSEIEPMTFVVKEIKLVHYKKRTLTDIVAPDITFRLGGPLAFTGQEIKWMMLQDAERVRQVERLKEELFAKFENGTPQELKVRSEGDNPYAKLFRLNEETGTWELVITREDVQNWGLEKWAEDYRKKAPAATAGIRDQQNILYPYDPRYPINLLGVVLTAVAKAEMLEAKAAKPSREMLVGGDVRYNTEKYIDLVSRVYAAKGIKVHTPRKGKKTTIWMSSFLVAMRELDAGDYVTASHSNRDISATKLLSSEGSQLLIEEMIELTDRILAMVKEVKEKGSFTIRIAAEDDPNILQDIDNPSATSPIEALGLYVGYLRSGVASPRSISQMERAGANNLKIGYDLFFGSMIDVFPPIVRSLGVEGLFEWHHNHYDPFFGGIGVTHYNPKTKKDEYFDLSGDMSILDVVKTAGYERLLADKPVGSVEMVTDPDGDRLVIMQIEANMETTKRWLGRIGIDFISLNEDKILAVYTPNQSFLMAMDYRKRQMEEKGTWAEYNWFIIKTTPSAAAWDEWAARNDIPVVNVPVGFKEIADIMRKVEKQIEINNERQRRGLTPLEVVIHDVFGRRINLGTKPRLLFGGEESGGMIVGQEELLQSFRIHKQFLAMREKSAGEASILIAGLIAELYNEGNPMLSEKLASIFETARVQRRYDVRVDITLYDASAPLEEQKRQKEEGIAKRNRNDAFFLSLAFALKDERIDINRAKSILREAFPNLDFSNLREILFVGDGTYLDFEDKYVEVRPSGTDAKNKAYSCSGDKEASREFAKALGDFDPQGKELPVYLEALREDQRDLERIFERKQSEYRKFLQRDSNPTIAPELTAQDSAV